MATLFRNSNSPVWRARFYTKDGRRISRTTGTTSKREATRIAAQLEIEHRAQGQGQEGLSKNLAVIVETAAREAQGGRLTLARAEELVSRLHRLANPEFQEVTLADWLERWIDSQANHVRPVTLRNYRGAVQRWAGVLGSRIMSRSLRKLTHGEIEAGLGKMHVGRCGSTCNDTLATLRAALAVAERQGLVTSNPASFVRSLPTSDSVQRGPFTPAEVARMLEHPRIGDEWRGLILLAATTGLRMGDLVTLGAGHVHEGALVVRPSKSARTGRVVTIPLTPEALAWIGDRAGDFFPRLRKKTGPGRSGRFREIMAMAEVPHEIVRPGGVVIRRSFHSLRHSFVSWLAEGGVASDVRMRLSGHSTQAVHAGYSHHDETLRDAMRQIPALCAGERE